MQYSQDELLGVLRDKFGYESFLPAQEKVIRKILDGQSTLAVMPTGSGKSLCFQLPALMLQGLCLVVSPMISLMKDQVMQVRDLGIAARMYNSMMTQAEQQETLAEVISGKLKLLYVAPETLLKDWFLSHLKAIKIELIAIDEAHCISMWGHNFRPEYLQLSQLREHFPDATYFALTATAIPKVQKDICGLLAIPPENMILESFDRPNLLLIIEPKQDSYNRLIRFLNLHPDESGIVYCMTRKRVDTISNKLIADGFSALPYHAGLNDNERHTNQEAFIRDKVQIMVATIAFGMGINKSNVRFVIHMDLPKSLETYYQEIGRAGRDGLPSTCLLFYSLGDFISLKKIIFNNPDPQQNYITQTHLDAMVRYCESKHCRRAQILKWFGEQYTQDNCDMCDICLSDKAEKIDATEPAKMFLSALYRAQENATADEIIKILRGSKAKAILEAGYDKLSVYGIGKESSTKDWFSLFTALKQQGGLVQSSFSKLKLTPKSWAIMKGEESFTMNQSLISQMVESGESQESGLLFDELKNLRRTLADERGFPPYIVFSDRSLREMARAYPCDLQSFSTIPGVGDHKLSEYGAAFIKVIAEYCAKYGIEPPEISQIVRPVPKKNAQSKSFIVAEYVKEGHNAQETMLHFGVKLDTIVDHLMIYLEHDGTLDYEQMQSFYPMAPEAFQEISAAFGQVGLERLRPVRDLLQERYSYNELRLARLIYLCKVST
ncbi:MAG: DNA helicase RecQ [Candidatus Cloacimonetes bacterium]|nr:DNA helicase RecQ [Candidatus Cloacimonadota bacterium]MCB5288256.1 DNA helicase RecQ [Candidatus Cloacimonadota bacterium]MCK9184091.1 DNA helicase RecQ [Candidatus Cloacimonadota bacterium]MDY0230577.1 DNA helicase RecQ [Candidatus Cloacimonadaceae bacterium]